MEAIKKVLPDVTFIHGDSISDSAGPEMVVGHDLCPNQTSRHLRRRCTSMAESIEDAARWIGEYVRSGSKILVKDLSVFDKAIDHYESSL